jgi:PadR family transcriptional regulator PadR
MFNPKMRGGPMEMLTKLEELILLSVWKLKENAYGTTIYKHIQQITTKKLSLGGVYFPLERLTRKGYLHSYIGEATEERRGLSKRYYQLTEKGIKALDEIKRINEIMWAGYSDLAFLADKNV